MNGSLVVASACAGLVFLALFGGALSNILSSLKRKKRNEMLRAAMEGSYEELLEVLRAATIVECPQIIGFGRILDVEKGRTEFSVDSLGMYDLNVLGTAIGSWIWMYDATTEKVERPRSVAEALVKKGLSEEEVRSFIAATGKKHYEVVGMMQPAYERARRYAELELDRVCREKRQLKEEKARAKAIAKGLRSLGAEPLKSLDADKEGPTWS